MRKFIITISTIIGAVIAVAMPTAWADDRLQPNELEYIAQYGAEICATIADDPSPPTVIHIGNVIIEDGFEPESAVDIINYTVTIYCDQWGPLLDETSQVYGNKGPMKRAL